MFKTIAFVIIAACSVIASPHPQIDKIQSMITHSNMKGQNKAWSLIKAAPLKQEIVLKIALKQNNMPGLLARLTEISDPDHADFRQFLTNEQVIAYTGPEQASVDRVLNWLSSSGIKDSQIEFKSAAKDYLDLMLSIQQANSLLATEFSVYSADKETIIRTESYAVPEKVLGDIDFIQPTTMFGTPRPVPIAEKPELGNSFKKNADVGACSSSGITPACLRQLYNMTYTSSSAKSKIGISGFLNQYANKKDLALFAKKYLPGPAQYFFESVKGGLDEQSDPGIEANLDVQYGIGLSYPTKNIFFSVKGSPPFIPDASTTSNTNEPYLDLLNYLSLKSNDDLPQVLTTSYGDNEQTVPFEYASRVCNDFGVLGARGVSILFSSGDGGVGGGQSSICTSNDGTQTRRFLPVFPAGCPYVTAVGGTVGFTPERAISLTGGGFSNYFATPDYQKNDVASYITGLKDVYQGLYNTSGRGYPDIAAQGQNFNVYSGGYLQPVSGTSASCPAAAAIISNLNDILFNNGKAPLGFLNPWLYKYGSKGFNDITTGTNPGCNTKGFSAAVGWDPVTGFGSPNFGKLVSLI